MRSDSILRSETLQLFPLLVIVNSNYILADSSVEEWLTRTHSCPKLVF